MNQLIERNEIITLGKSLREIQPQLLKQNYQEGAKRMWFQGEEPYFDVFFETQNHQITWFQFTLRGKTLSWDNSKPGWQTGISNELKINDVSFYAASKLIENDPEIDWEFIKLVKSILEIQTHEEMFVKALELFDEKTFPST
ncbi:hypothetical protein [Calothrix sp. PCC 6303]|uniref:hypothetical protein n=1 Tax=Calothrix sp. PCC 6303 TaxID=1170562 RepID=UPI0002A02A21|nr:hypothetical protein [Calothrix sp. PCC 6303]AFY99977.1 hypothetical protein Cal6303_0913 [Calothrix sp. PCC 6303]